MLTYFWGRTKEYLGNLSLRDMFETLPHEHVPDDSNARYKTISKVGEYWYQCALWRPEWSDTDTPIRAIDGEQWILVTLLLLMCARTGALYIKIKCVKDASVSFLMALGPMYRGKLMVRDGLMYLADAGAALVRAKNAAGTFTARWWNSHEGHAYLRREYARRAAETSEMIERQRVLVFKGESGPKEKTIVKIRPEPTSIFGSGTSAPANIHLLVVHDQWEYIGFDLPKLGDATFQKTVPSLVFKPVQPSGELLEGDNKILIKASSLEKEEARRGKAKAGVEYTPLFTIVKGGPLPTFDATVKLDRSVAFELTVEAMEVYSKGTYFDDRMQKTMDIKGYSSLYMAMLAKSGAKTAADDANPPPHTMPAGLAAYLERAKIKPSDAEESFLMFIPALDVSAAGPPPASAAVHARAVELAKQMARDWWVASCHQCSERAKNAAEPEYDLEAEVAALAGMSGPGRAGVSARMTAAKAFNDMRIE